MSQVMAATDGQLRCGWCVASPEYVKYHDKEWGFPVADDIRLFEKLSLECFQSGLSWRTILAKRDHFRRAFLQFDYQQLALFTEADVERLLQDSGIVRHRGKIEAVIHNARCAIKLIQQQGSLAAYFWQFEPKADRLPTAQTASTSAEAIALSKALKQQGWKFVGPTTVYAFMQAMGLVNDHAEHCIVRSRVEAARNAFEVPSRPAHPHRQN